MTTVVYKTSPVEEAAVRLVLDDSEFLWWRDFRNHFAEFRLGFGNCATAFYSDVFSIIAEEMSKDDKDRNHEA